MVERQAISGTVKAQVEYRDIPGFPGYRVGNDGTVWYCWKRGWQNQRYLSDEWKLMKLAKNERGYLRVNLVPLEGGRYKTLKVHRLVLEAFVGACPQGMECRHLNSIRSDCRLTNLAWGTRAENQRDVRECGGYTYGEQHAQARLTENSVREIRAWYAKGVFQRDLARGYDCSLTNISAIVNGRSWRHVD